jgi:hypothetical protein
MLIGQDTRAAKLAQAQTSVSLPVHGRIREAHRELQHLLGEDHKLMLKRTFSITIGRHIAKRSGENAAAGDDSPG